MDRLRSPSFIGRRGRVALAQFAHPGAVSGRRQCRYPGRVIADELSKALGQPVIVENRPGAGGNLAATEAARSAPDGYTLYMGTTSTNATNINLYEKLSYDPVHDFQPLTLVTVYPQVVVPGIRAN